MKTLIAYGTKYGCAEKRAKSLSEKLNGEVDLCNLKNGKAIELTEYDTVIIGGSIYAGQIRKEVKQFVSKNLKQLLGKKIGLFVCCMGVDASAATISNVFPKELVDHATVKDGFGGEFDTAKMNFLEKTMVKVIAKGNVPTAPVGDLDGFAQAINNK